MTVFQTTVKIDPFAELELLSVSQEAGVFAVKSEDNRRFFIFAHAEYDDDTLAQEYFRDVRRGSMAQP